MKLGKEIGTNATPRRYLNELEAREVGMPRDIDEIGAIRRVADQLDIKAETLRAWTQQSGNDDGEPVRVCRSARYVTPTSSVGVVWR